MLPAEIAPRLRAPALPAERKWHSLTERWWRDVWHSPMATEYVRADEHALFRLATLIDIFWTEPTKELAAEIRLEQQAFGLTPLDRRRLEWTVERTEQARLNTDKMRSEGAILINPDDDPRTILR